ncbi:MAG TPA: hypothetical protein VFI96_06675 [Longimicrobiaceae bacterium]|nr:hypothetical protein [Longimicrobiaceae bacterium]
MSAVMGQGSVHINHNLTPPSGARATGELYLGVYPVYERTVERHAQEQVKGEDGEPLFHRHPATGVVTSKPVTRLETWEEDEEFILMPVGNGQTEIVRDFRPSPDEAATVRRAEANAPDKLAERLSRLEAGMNALGLTPDAIEEALQKAEDDVAGPPADEKRGRR